MKCNVDMFPNDVYEGGVESDGPGPDVEPDGEEQVEEEPHVSASSSPPVVSELARQRHYLSGHVLYRSWCPHCLRVRGRDNQHKPTDSASRDYPILHWDYAYLFSKNVDDDSAAENRRDSPLLCMRDDKAKGIYPYLNPF